MTDQLQQALKLSPADLTANRSGQLSDSQKRQLTATVSVFLMIFGFALVVIIGVMVASLFVVTQPLVVIAVFSIPLYFVVRVLLNLRKSYAMRREEVNAGVVASVAGVAAHIHMTRGSNLMVGEEHFFVPTPILNQIEPGDSYRVYYLPRSRTFIAAERIFVPR